MEPKNTISKKFGLLANKLKTNMIVSIVPKHMRRAIFACSLAAKISNKPQTQHAVLAKKLCVDLELLCAYNAMLTPMSWNQRIWNKLPDLDITIESNGSAFIKAATTIMQNTPESLHYASPRIMLEDTINTLRAALRVQPSSFIEV